MDPQSLKQFGVTQGLQWIFSSADAPWQNGVSEALIKSIKKAITIAIGENVTAFSELQTVCFEAANLVNERPIGRHPTSPDDESYLCPNDLLLGRSTSRVPSGPFAQTDNPRRRYEFIQKIVDNFWRKWTRDYFSSLIIQQKWHTAKRNLKTVISSSFKIQTRSEFNGSLEKSLKCFQEKTVELERCKSLIRIPNQRNHPINTLEEDTLRWKDQLTDWYYFYQSTKRKKSLTKTLKHVY